jgi:hypothetical protein
MVGTMTQLDNFIFTCDCAMPSVSPALVEGSRALLTSPSTSAQKIKVKRLFQPGNKQKVSCPNAVAAPLTGYWRQSIWLMTFMQQPELNPIRGL